MDAKGEIKALIWILGIFAFAYFLPLEYPPFHEALLAALDLSRWYAREHVILCLLPAFLIAGVIAVFISQGAVIRYFGADAKKWLSYSVASVSGSILAVCSCTILPLFSSIHKRGAGLGPAVTFLYSGPAINILAIILTARILGWEMGLARIAGAIIFSILIGVVMSFLFKKDEEIRQKESFQNIPASMGTPLWKTAIHFFLLVLILVFVNWGKPGGEGNDTWSFIWSNKWLITGILGLGLMLSLVFILKIKWWWVILSGGAVALTAWLSGSNTLAFVVAIALVSMISIFSGGDNQEWIISSWDFTRQILPLLAIGVVIAGFLLGSVHGDTQISGIIPSSWISALVGGNSVSANLFASVVGAFMYFATLTEIPILQGLIASGMGKGPALALLLAGPSISLPNILVIRGVIGTKKTLVYVVLVIIMASIAGIIYGAI